jgi:hypothetical protein
MINVKSAYIASDNGCIILGNTHQQLMLCEVGMARKSRATESGLLMLFFLLVLSFAIASWFGKDLYTIIIAVLFLATLVMIGMIVRKKGRRIAFKRSARVAKRKLGKGIVLGVVGVGILVFLVLIATPTINWFSQNLHTVITVLLLLAALAVIGGLAWINRRKIASRGSGGGTCLDEYTWTPQNMNDPLALDVWQSIIDFKCKKRYELEYFYHHELFEWLQRKFPEAKIEPRKGSSRPDITIGNIAIEVKGPTNNTDLRTIADKILRYGHHYSLIFVILFTPQLTERYFAEWAAGVRRQSHKVGVITKE